MSADTVRSPTGVHVRFLDGPIDPPAWSRAEWGGVGYLTDVSGRVPPSLGLVFHKPGHGRRIFRAWRARFGPDGADAVLRVAVIEGPLTGYPPGFFVHLGADPGWTATQAPVGLPAPGPCTPVAGYVVHRATPPAGTDHLAAFKAALARHGRYTLVPVLWGGCRFEPIPDLAVRMTRIQFRAAADVGAGDIDRVCFGHDLGRSRGKWAGNGTDEKSQARKSSDDGLDAEESGDRGGQWARRH
jgi:hypothetical protein